MLKLTGTLIAVAAASSAQASSKPQTSLLAAEDGYAAAVIGRDAGALAATLSDELIYVHASGEAQDKTQYLAGTVAGGFRVKSIRFIERNDGVFGQIGVVQGRVAYDVGEGEKIAGYMAVYRMEAGKWKLLRWQNAKPSVPAGGK